MTYYSAASGSCTADDQCGHYGNCQSNSTCACYGGWGGNNCNDRTCGTDKTGTVKLASSASAACSCSSYKLGPSCQVCNTDDQCAEPQDPGNSGASSLGVIPTANNPNVCNRNSFAYAMGDGFVPVTISSNQAQIQIKRDLSERRFMTFYFVNREEQLSCLHTECSQQRIGEKTINVTSTAGMKTTCDKTQCTCVEGSKLCTSAITPQINGAAGDFEFECTGTDCSMTAPYLTALTGVSTLALPGTTFGECVRETAIWPKPALAAPIMAIVVVIAIIAFLIVVACIMGKIKQNKMKRSAPPPKLKGANVEWSDIKYVVKIHGKKKEILRGVSGYAHAGEMLGVLGPSGAGKSSLVDIIGGRAKSGTLYGRVGLNGVAKSPELLRQSVGFVDQEDVLPSRLTTRECLEFGVQLKLSEAIPWRAKSRRVEEVLSILGLSHVANTRVGNTEMRGLSGGEKRRLSIGLELLSQPEVLILDEPLSGLDSKTAKDVSDILHKLTRSTLKTTVIMTVHQPRSDIYYSLDKVILVARGEIIYHGVPDNAASYFAEFGHQCPSAYNPADFLLDVAHHPILPGSKYNDSARDATYDDEKRGLFRLRSNRTNTTDEDGYALDRMDTIRQYRERFLGKSGSIKRESYNASFITQFSCLFNREFKNLRRDPTLFQAHVFISCLVALILGGLYFRSGADLAGTQNRVGGLFFYVCLLCFSTVSCLAPFYREKSIFIRERASRYYGPLPWIINRVLFDLFPLRVIPTLIMDVIIYWMIGLNKKTDRFIRFLLITVLYNVCIATQTVCLGAFFGDQGVATLISALSGLNQILFAGFVTNQGAMPKFVGWVQWVVQSKYALEALTANEVVGLFLNDSIGGLNLVLPQDLIIGQLIKFDPSAYWRNAILLVMFAGLGVGALSSMVIFMVRERK